jgi:hypothetical protein
MVCWIEAIGLTLGVVTTWVWAFRVGERKVVRAKKDKAKGKRARIASIHFGDLPKIESNGYGIPVLQV